MSRSGYNEPDGDYSEWGLIRWRGQVASTIRGRNGQAFLQEMLHALDALPEKRLIKNELQKRDVEVSSNVEVCALGAVGLRRRYIKLEELDPEDYDTLAQVFGVTRQLIQEIEWVNDELFDDTPEACWLRVRKWVVKNMKVKPADDS